ncbi:MULTISPECIES: polyamine ABC transporter substrate-binding protein [unclassified Pseudomonas]|uniref:polyamine ABC transporter substrate-binding protein n=1 Tax=unclassified Pseudomonas TaxID=196821 RepID=UPI000BA4802C|nr:polyamine ABC transporter substrate-binding protein [Pseudomonas sp. Irchel 3H3]
MNTFRHCLLALCVASSGAAMAAETVRISNWSSYIASDTLSNFTQQTGVQTTYDLIDSNEMLEAKLITGSSGYDVVSPSNHFLAQLIKSGALQKLDKEQLPNWKNLDPQLLKMIEVNDPGNAYGFPYMWVTVGIGYNVQKIKEIFGSTEVTQSWSLLLEPQNIEKLKQCGVAFLDNSTQMLPITLNYLGLKHDSQDPADYLKAEAALLKVKPYVQYFHQSKYVSDLANGNICVAIGFSGDIAQATSIARDAKNGVELGYSIPREGSTLAVDMVVMPRNAPNQANGYAYMNYLMEPKVIADISNAIHYPNGNSASTPFLDPALRNDPAVYPSPEVMSTLFALKAMPPKVMRQATRLWTKVTSGR